MRLAGNVACIGEIRVVYRILVGKPEGKRPFVRPRQRWEDNIMMDLQEVGCGGMEWMELTQELKLYRTVIKPIVTYASETWVLKEAIIQKLLVFERKILRRIFGPTKENQIWRVKTNEELDKLIKQKYN